MKEFVEKLKKRAKRFLIDAKSDLESCEYDIALFHLEHKRYSFLLKQKFFLLV